MIMLDLNKSAGVLDLNKVAPTLKKIRGVLNWDINPIHGKSLTQGFDLDIFAFVLGADEKISSGADVVFFNNKNYGNGAVTVPVDNRTGDGDDDENIDIEFSKLPANKSHIDVYIFIHDADARQQSFGMMANAGFVLSDIDTGVGIVSYELQKYTNETALHVGRFSRTSNGWEFKPTGDVAQADPNQVVNAYV